MAGSLRELRGDRGGPGRARASSGKVLGDDEGRRAVERILEQAKAGRARAARRATATSSSRCATSCSSARSSSATRSSRCSQRAEAEHDGRRPGPARDRSARERRGDAIVDRSAPTRPRSARAVRDAESTGPRRRVARRSSARRRPIPRSPRWSRSSSAATAPEIPEEPDGGVTGSLAARPERTPRRGRASVEPSGGGTWTASGRPAGPAGASCTRRSARSGGGWSAASLAGFLWTAAKLTVPLLAAAAIDDGMRKGDAAATVRFVLIMLAVGVVQAVCTGAPALLRVPDRAADRDDLRQRLFAHLQRLHFAFHDQAQTGQLMARANTDIQQVETVVILIPLTAASRLTMVGVLGIMLLQSTGARAARARRSAVPATSPRTGSRDRIAPVNLALQEELADLSGVVEESRLRHPRREGLRRRADAGRSALDAEADSRARPGARRGEAAGRLPPARRLPPDALAGRDPLVRRSPGARRQARRSATSSRSTSTSSC